MAVGEERDVLAHQLGEQPALVVGKDGVADLRQDHGVSVGRRALDREDHNGDQRQQHDAAHVLVDIGLVDDLAEQVGRACGRRRPNAHQCERQQIAPPIGEALLGDQATNQDRRAIGVIGDFLWKVSHPRSIDAIGRYLPARQRLERDDSLPAKRTFFKSNKGVRAGRFQADSACWTSSLRWRNNFFSHASAWAAMVSRLSYCGVQSSVARMRLVSATMVMISPGLRGAYWTAKLRPETRRTASMVSSTE